MKPARYMRSLPQLLRSRAPNSGRCCDRWLPRNWSGWQAKTAGFGKNCKTGGKNERSRRWRAGVSGL
jgi:hypothetical protein